ncbi:pilus assembly protein [Phycisphaeraceae bacterium D3-23]
MQVTADIPTALANAAPASQAWWWETLTSGPAVTCLAIAGVCVLLLVFMGWRLRRTSPSRAGGGPSNESGVATIEFVLVAPFLLTVTLILIQTMLVFTGLFYVNYSAYAAARSAIVYIPANIGADGPNVLTPIEGGFKFDHIRAAAIIAVMPVSGQEEGDLQMATTLVSGLHRYYSAQGQTAPGWVDNLAEGRLNYAEQHTTVTVQSVNALDDGTVLFSDVTGQVNFGPKEAIAVQVRHEFALTVPVASQLFRLSGSRSDGANSGSYSPQSRTNNGSPPPPGTWTVIRARAILTNEGIDRTLPDPPRVPRR